MTSSIDFGAVSTFLSKTFSTVATISVNLIFPAKNPATATSFAAFKTRFELPPRFILSLAKFKAGNFLVSGLKNSKEPILSRSHRVMVASIIFGQDIA